MNFRFREEAFARKYQMLTIASVLAMPLIRRLNWEYGKVAMIEPSDSTCVILEPPVCIADSSCLSACDCIQ